MSNHSLLLRLREAACDYEAEKLTSEEFSALLDNIIEALEGMPYRIIREMRTFRHRIEISGFHEEEETMSGRQTVVAELRTWIDQLEHQRIQK